MESNGPEDSFSSHAFEPSGEFDLGDGESVSEMEGSVHVLLAFQERQHSVLNRYEILMRVAVDDDSAKERSSFVVDRILSPREGMEGKIASTAKEALKLGGQSTDGIRERSEPFRAFRAH